MTDEIDDAFRDRVRAALEDYRQRWDYIDIESTITSDWDALADEIAISDSDLAKAPSTA